MGNRERQTTTMDSGRARQTFLRYAGAMAYVAVERPNGAVGIGTAFHVGDGVFVTASHVVEGATIREIGITERTYVPLEGDEAKQSRVHVRDADGREHPVHIVDDGVLELDCGPYFHKDRRVDVACFRVKQIDPRAPWVRLGDHLDDWLGASDFTLEEVIIFGYPPIPLTNRPHLVAARAEVNAQVDLRDGQHVHFVLSSMPRGGFSGGLAITENDVALGVITRSLLTADLPPELGYFAVLSVEPIYICLADHKLLPERQAEGWDDLWNSTGEYYYERGTSLRPGFGGAVGASLETFDDGRRLGLTVHCNDVGVLVDVLERVSLILSGFDPRPENVHDHLVRFHVRTVTDDARRSLDIAKREARELLIAAGYVPPTSTQRETGP